MTPVQEIGEIFAVQKIGEYYQFTRSWRPGSRRRSRRTVRRGGRGR